MRRRCYSTQGNSSEAFPGENELLLLYQELETKDSLNPYLRWATMSEGHISPSSEFYIDNQALISRYPPSQRAVRILKRKLDEEAKKARRRKRL